MKINFENIPIIDLDGNDFKKILVASETFEMNFISKTLGNMCYLYGSDKIAELGKQIYLCQEVEIPLECMDELLKLIDVIFKKDPKIIARSLKEYLNTNLI